MRAVTVVVLVAAVLFVAAVAKRGPKWSELSTTYTYAQYVRDFGKNVAAGSAEWNQREAIFNEKLAAAIAHNAAGASTYKKGVNRFTDRTPEELRRINGGRAVEMQKYRPSAQATAPLATVPPGPKDWRTAFPPVLTAVKDQGQCGSCWAHGSTETMESHWAIQTGDLFVLSQQQVTACAPNPDECGGTGGCMGSIAQLAYNYTINAGGLTQEWQYSYTAYQGTTGDCIWNKTLNPPVAKFSSYVTLPSNQAENVYDTVANIGPVAVNVDASTWFEYDSGIFDGCDYAKNITIDHVVQLVGWGIDPALNNTEYWLIRNSWSAGYGELGYIRLKRYPAGEPCGWNTQAQDGTACKGQPSIQWTCGMCGVLFDSSYPVVKTN